MTTSDAAWYAHVASEIFAGRVPAYAIKAVRDLDPGFAAYLDEHQEPPPASPAASAITECTCEECVDAIGRAAHA